MEKKLRFGFIGCGLISETHAVAVESAEKAELVAVFDNNKEKMAEFVKRHPADTCDSLEELLNRDDIDVISVLVPSALHSQFGIQVAEHKKHIIVEKPIDTDYKRALALVEAAEKNGVTLAVTLQHHYDDAVIAAKKAIDAGELGQLNLGSSHNLWWRDQVYFDSAPWRGQWATNGGGTLIMQAIHYIDLLIYMMGDVDEVHAFWTTRSHNIEVEDVAVASLKFKSGALGIIEGTTAAYPGFTARLDIMGDKGGITIVDDAVSEWQTASGKTYDDFKVAHAEAVTPPDEKDDFGGVWTLNNEAHKAQYVSIIDDILAGRKVGVTGRDGLRPLKLILAIYESGRTGKTIKMDEFNG